MNTGFEEYWKWQQHPQEVPDTFFAKHWSHTYAGILSSADYFYEGNYKIYNAQRIFHYHNVPDNNFGYNPAHSGKAYVGIIPLQTGLYMEHLTGTLTQPLQKGKNYEISFFIKYPGKEIAINLRKLEVAFSSDSTFFMKNRERYYAIDKTDSYAIYDSIFRNNKKKADIIFDNLPLLNDTSDWMKLSAFYTAKGGETFFTLGLFEQDEDVVKRLKKMRTQYQKITDFNKRKKFLEKIKKNKIPFIEFNPDYDWSMKGFGTLGVSDFGYYFIDDVFIVPIEN